MAEPGDVVPSQDIDRVHAYDTHPFGVRVLLDDGCWASPHN